MKNNFHFTLLLFCIVIGTTGCSSYTAVDLEPGPGIPPDLGRKINNRTLLGIDSDNDGVRDDVQRYIIALEIDHPFFKRGLLQYAAAMQTALKEADHPDRAKINVLLTGRALGCFWSADINGKEKNITFEELRRVILNTPTRRKAGKKWVRHIQSSFLRSTSNSAQEVCDFDVELFEGERWR